MATFRTFLHAKILPKICPALLGITLISGLAAVCGVPIDIFFEDDSVLAFKFQREELLFPLRVE
ncbi:MAG: hypothetical protein D6690_10835 [Nitrospirae bacterium]|nr:MAG: hypothetical protein D6690_10835 [Nitrospirota bacterium]